MLLDCRYTNLVLGNSSVWQDKENQYQDIMLKNYSFDTSIVEIQNSWEQDRKIVSLPWSELIIRFHVTSGLNL